MGFNCIYEVVEEIKDKDVHELLCDYGIEVMYVDDLDVDAMYIHTSRPRIIIRNDLDADKTNIVLLHELGHYLFDKKSWLSNQRTNENNANLFVCLHLIKNKIWEHNCFYGYLIDCGLSPKIARAFNDRTYQYKLQVKYELNY
ncbi:MAG: ImmA/IrrE family metallo-endopeptidase [Cellulosilyticaceae bacterium]